MTVKSNVPSRVIATHFDRSDGIATGRRTPSRGWRARWAAIGAAIAVVAGTGGVAISGATNAQTTPSQTLIAPCRIMDTRSGPANVGARNTPLAGGETYSIQVTGTNGNCTIPSDASGVVMNVTIVGPGSNGFLTVFPGGTLRPTASNLNFVAGQAPTPNQVTVSLGNAGQVAFFASGGPVNVIADIAGYTSAARLTSAQLAQNRWDRDLAKPVTIGSLQNPSAVAFDGTNIWVTDLGSNSVVRVNPTIGSVVGAPIPVGDFPSGIAFDGANMWVTNFGSNNVTRINATTGNVIGSPIAVGTGPRGIAFDGTNMWVANNGSDSITRLEAATGNTVGSPIATGDGPFGLAFDGTVMWVANFNGNSVGKYSIGSGTSVGTYSAFGINPIGLAFDGTDMWVAYNGANTVRRINSAPGSVPSAPISVGTNPHGVAFDGTNIWVANSGSNNATVINATTGATVGSPISLGAGPRLMAFDGTSMWVANANAGTVSKVRTG